jgi:phosphonate transport system substrate-binding protein
MSKTRFKKLRLWAMKVFMMLTALIFVPWEDSHAGEADKFHVNIGFSSRVFVNVPKEDIRIAVQVLSQKVARKTVGTAESRIYETDSEFERALKTKKLDVLAFTPEEFLQLRGQFPLEPIMVTESGKSHELELLLLTRKDSGISRFAELKNRTIALPSEISQFGTIYHSWLENLTMKEGARSPSTFLASLIETHGASKAIMLVFFRKSDACIISRNSFEVSNELNPQLSRNLKVIASMGKLVAGIVAIRQDLTSERKQKIRHALLTLHEDTDGKQMFVLFQLTRLAEFRPEYLKATEALLAENSALKKRFSSRR